MYWRYYRLGDMVVHANSRLNKNGRELHYEKYPDSIASRYMRLTDKKRPDFGILIDLIAQYPKELAPKEGDLVVHLRVGDVLDARADKYSVDDFLNTEERDPASGKSRLVKSLNYFRNLQLSHLKISRVVIVASDSHPGTSCTSSSPPMTKSKEYIQRIKEFFESLGYPVCLRYGHDPDEDFVFMCRSKMFVPSGGNFTWLIQEVHLRLMDLTERDKITHYKRKPDGTLQ